MPRNGRTAVQWLRKAIKSGNLDAQRQLGEIYIKGLVNGIPNRRLAHMWYTLVAANGDADAAITRDDIAKKLSSTVIVSSQKQAKRCFESGYKDCD